MFNFCFGVHACECVAGSLMPRQQKAEEHVGRVDWLFSGSSFKNQKYVFKGAAWKIGTKSEATVVEAS